MCILLIRGSTLRKTFFYKKENTSFFFKHWAKHVRKMPNFIAAFFKLHITWPQTLFGKFSWGSSSYLIYFGLLAKTIRSVCQNWFLWALRIVLREKGFFLKIFFHVFRNWIKHFLYFWQNNFGSVTELTLEEPRGTFWEQWFFLKKKYSFSDFERKAFG